MSAEMSQSTTVDYEALRARLAQENGPAYWRSLDELAHLGEVNEAFHQEFPSTVSDTLDPVSRRNFVKLMGASMMLAGLASCARQPDETIVPYVQQPEQLLLGKPQYFASAYPFSGYGLGIVATSFNYRPTKVDGLREHPSSLGGSDSFAQASLLDLYDPDRLDATLHRGQLTTWKAFINAAATAMQEADPDAGAGLRILTGTVTSPTLTWQIRRILSAYPEAKWHQYEAVNQDNVRAGTELAFGRIVHPVYHFDNADVILSLDSDFLVFGPGRVRYSLDFANGRAAALEEGRMSRMYAAECSPTLTGANADHKINLRYKQVETLARLVASGLGVSAQVDAAASGDKTLPAGLPNWVESVVEDLRAAGSRAVVVAGDEQPAVVHALAHAINSALGSAGTAVTYHEPVEAEPSNQLASITELATDMRDGKVRSLVILGGNPVYDTPADLNFAGALEAMAGGAVFYLTSHRNETSKLCHWVVPEAHYLESWSDVRGHDGTVSIIQPLIQPLFQGKTSHEVLEALLGSEVKPMDVLRQSWTAQRGPDGFDAFWKTALSMGVVEGTASPEVTVQAQFEVPAQVPGDVNGVDIVFRPDASLFDGRFNNNGWMQELPHPLTKLTWDNAILMSPKTAAMWHVTDEDLVDLSYGGRTIRGPVLRVLGHPDQTVTVHLGYGRASTGKVGEGVGFNAYQIQTAESPYYGTGVSVTKLGQSYLLARTEDHHLIEQSDRAHKRFLVRQAPLDLYNEHHDFAQHMGHMVPTEDFTLYDPVEKKWDGYNWGMSIDLQRCTGCNACIVACQSENNIPIVGKTQISKGREMYWIRVDRYYRGTGATGFENPGVVFQPLPCMQCENAPCEPVCPVAATTHSEEGLNDMVYNRCIGTRYCANNCPYKVRRFNFFHWHIEDPNRQTPTLQMARNPNVTVRSRGVMEKCTYCVQRINSARINAKRENRQIRDGEVVTACQSACPTRAITFGDISDSSTVVAQQKKNPRTYGLLADIGTRPRTTYMAAVSNPAPKLKSDDLDVIQMHGVHSDSTGAEH
jgi:molybdopterin-containing oxidoreductase family iron-sulfur binding subunit